MKPSVHPALSGSHHALITAENPAVKHSNGGNDKLEADFKAKNYKYQKVKGHYGGKEENSYLVHNPDPKHIKELGVKYGQESVLISHNKKHTLHYTAGPKKDQHIQGSGTAIHAEKPEDNYSAISHKGKTVHFTHNLNFEKSIKKDEDLNKTKLIHYSTTPGLKEIDPKKHGTGAPSSEYKRGLPEVARSYYYEAGKGPHEDIVTGQAKAKYTAELKPHHKIYDLAHDKDKHIETAVKENQNIWNTDKILGRIKEHGYHGFKNSNSSLPHVVGVFHPHPVKEEHKMDKYDIIDNMKESEVLEKAQKAAIIAHTSTNKPIYSSANNKAHKDFSGKEHHEAYVAHYVHANRNRDNKRTAEDHHAQGEIHRAKYEAHELLGAKIPSFDRSHAKVKLPKYDKNKAHMTVVKSEDSMEKRKQILMKFYVELPLLKGFQANGLLYAAEHQDTGAIFILRKSGDNYSVDGHFNGQVYSDLESSKSEGAAQIKLATVMAQYAHEHLLTKKDDAPKAKGSTEPLNGSKAPDGDEDAQDPKQKKKKKIDHQDMVTPVVAMEKANKAE